MRSTLLGIDHVALRCFDTKATERFYGEFLGLPVVERADGMSEEWEGRVWRLTGFRLPSGALLDFFEVEGTQRPPSQGYLDTVQHVALAVATRADLEAWRVKLEGNGFPILEEQDHGEGRHSLYFADPNGHYVELTCRPRR
ncbi:MAG TPA: VOC family protein [Myxococcota bacterium]|nr:VOC family protein [Myxococcota bacterium]